jgi:hypothetical protein
MGYLPLYIIVNQVNVYPRTISINNPKTQFINFIFNLVSIDKYLDGKYYLDGARELNTTYIKNYMTADYYKQSLEPILLRTCNRLYEKGYLYDANEPELNGWIKFLKDITDIEVLAPDVKVFNMSFDFYRNSFKNDYKKLAMLEIFENRFKKELIRKV